MAEPQPPAIHEGAETPPAPAPAGGAAAASEAAALSSLDNKNLSGSDSSAAPKKEVDLKALNDAMKALGTGDGGNSKKAAAAGSSLKKASTEEPAKLIKVEAADVGLLVRLLLLRRFSSVVFVLRVAPVCFGIGCGEPVIH